MKTILARDWPFWKVTVLVLLAATAWTYAPVFIARIPFPAYFIYEFPSFDPLIPPDINSKVANIGDLVSSFYPYRTLAGQTLRDGELPLWNPYLLSGAPFQANPQSALFYPLNAFYYILPVPIAWCIGFLLRTFLSGFFTALLLRKIGASTTGSVVAGLIFAFSGFLTVWQGQAMSDAAIWLPLICYSVARLHMARSAASIALCAVAFAMPVLAGHPETAAHLTALGIGFAAFLAFLRPFPGLPRRPVRFLGCFSAAGILAVGIAAIQIVPTMEWLKYASRGFGDLWPAAPLWGLFGFISRDILRSTNSFGLEIPEHAAYIGLLTFLAAPIALLGPARRYVVFFGVSLVVAICVAYGFQPIYGISQQIPFWNSLKNHRLILIATFSAAVLAGLGVSALESLNWQDRRRSFRAGMLGAVGFSAAFMMIYLVRFVTMMIVETSRFPRVSFLFLSASALVVALRLTGLLNGPWFRTAVLAIVLSDVCSFAYGFIPFVKPRDIFPANPLFEQLSGVSAQPFRVAQTGYAYPANTELMYGVSSVGGYEIPLTRLKKFVEGLARNEADSVMFNPEEILEVRDRRLDMLSTRYFVVSEWHPLYRRFRENPDRFRLRFEYGDTGIFENLTTLPFALLVPSEGIELVGDESRQLEIVKDPGFNPELKVVLPAAFSGQSATPSPPAGNTKPGVSWESRGTGHFQLKVAAALPSVLVVSQTYYPGWKAWVDGESAEILPANYALTAIRVAPGSHDVRFAFEPASFRIGLILSSLAMVVVAFLIGYNVRRQRAR